MGLATESRTDKIRTERSSGVMPHLPRVGEDVGMRDGAEEGMALGNSVGDEVGSGDTVGLAVGTLVGRTDTLGEELGADEGELEMLGAKDGKLVSTGELVGSITGAKLPPAVGKPMSNGGESIASTCRYGRVNARVFNRWHFRTRFTWVHRDRRKSRRSHGDGWHW